MTSKSKPRENRSGRFAFLSRLKSRRVRSFVAASTFGALAALGFGLGFDIRSDAAPPLRPPRSARPVEQLPPGAPVAPEAATKSNLPFAGIATKTPEEIDAELAGKSTQDLQTAAFALEAERMNADAAVLFERVIYSDDASVQMRVRALESFDFFRGNRRNRAEERLLELSRRFSDSWRVQAALVEHLNRWPKRGVMVDGVFDRSVYSTRDQLDSTARDRVLALQLLNAALPKAQAELTALFPNGLDAAPDVEALKASPTFQGHNATFLARKDGVVRQEFRRFYQVFANVLGDDNERWRLQVKTDLDVLPDCEPAQNRYRTSRLQGAPVDAAGAPVFFSTPESFEAARNDGERLRFIQAQKFAVAERLEKFQILMEQGVNARAVFGVQTLANYSRYFPSNPNAPTSETGIWDLHTLDDSETIAKLATGVKRFKLPDDENCLVLWREALEYADGAHRKADALNRIAQEYSDRGQYDKALELYRRALAEKGTARQTRDYLQKQIDQIVDPWGRFDFAASKINGAETVVSVICRNADAVEFVVREIDATKLLAEFRQAANSDRKSVV